MSSDGRWVRGSVVATDGQWEKVKVELPVGGRTAVEWVDVASERICALGEMTSTALHPNGKESEAGGRSVDDARQHNLKLQYHRRQILLWLVVTVAVTAAAAGMIFRDSLGYRGQMAAGVAAVLLALVRLLPSLCDWLGEEVRYGDDGNVVHRVAFGFMKNR